MFYLALYLYLVGALMVYGLLMQVIKLKEPPMFENNHTYSRKRRVPTLLVALLWPAFPVVWIFVSFF